MRDVDTKTDGVDSMPAANYNAQRSELENAVTSTDQTLDPDAGPDTDLNMLGKAMAGYANAANVYQDSGAADAYVLSIASNLKSVTKYYDNMMIVFKAGNSNTGASTVNVNTLGVKSITLPDGTALGVGDIVSGEYIIAIYNLGSDRFEITYRGALVGRSVQVVTTQDGAVAFGNTSFPDDDTIPQNNEGDEFITLSITPKNAANKLVIEVTGVWSSDVAGALSVALFQDTTANALAAVQEYLSLADKSQTINFKHEMTAGTTSATTFKIRAGNVGAVGITFNGVGGVRKLGGVSASSIVITEIQQ